MTSRAGLEAPSSCCGVTDTLLQFLTMLAHCDDQRSHDRNSAGVDKALYHQH